MTFEIKEGALLIADVHYAPYREEFLDFLEYVREKNPPQIFLFGDIFDYLVGEASYSVDINQKPIELINSLAEGIEIIYLEGNHDFNLKSVFPKLKIIKRSEQPLVLKFKNLAINVAHGDRSLSLLHEIYFWIISSRFVVKLLDFFDRKFFADFVSKKIFEHLSKKVICRGFVGFLEFVTDRKHLYGECNIYIEGHYHQDVGLEIGAMRYINLSSFACNRSFFCVESLNSGFELNRVII